MPDQKSLRIILLGIFTAVCSVTALLYFIQLIEFAEVAPIVTMLSGILILAMAAVRLLSPGRSARGAFSTAWWGSVLFLVGAVWLLKVDEVFTVYTFWAVLAFIIGALTVVFGMHKWVTREEKKPRGRPKKLNSKSQTTGSTRP